MSKPNVTVINGRNGGAYIGGTSANTGQWELIQVIADVKFHTLTGTISGGIANTTSGSAPTIPAGTILPGTFTAIQLHSGAVVAYL
jgi:hypothetical protein